MASVFCCVVDGDEFFISALISVAGAVGVSLTSLYFFFPRHDIFFCMDWLGDCVGLDKSDIILLLCDLVSALRAVIDWWHELFLVPCLSLSEVIGFLLMCLAGCNLKPCTYFSSLCEVIFKQCELLYIHLFITYLVTQLDHLSCKFAIFNNYSHLNFFFFDYDSKWLHVHLSVANVFFHCQHNFFWLVCLQHSRMPFFIWALEHMCSSFKNALIAAFTAICLLCYMA